MSADTKLVVTSQPIFDTETELLELFELRDALERDPDLTPAELKESHAAIDQQILTYIRGSALSGGIAAVLAECELQAENIAAVRKREQERMKRAEDKWLARAERIKDVIRLVMEELGIKRIECAGGRVVSLKKNPASVAVTTPGLLPANFQRVKVTMTLAVWQRISTLLTHDECAECGAPEPMKDAIKAELNRLCGKCLGTGARPDGDLCLACGGSGKRSVPGAALSAEIYRVEIS